MKGYSENAQVIWYDSVTSDGKLAWQNELNQHNRYLIILILTVSMGLLSKNCI